MGDDDDGKDFATNSDIDEVDHQSYHQVDQQGDLNKAALGVDHHGLEDRLLGRQRWGNFVASLSPVLK